MIEVFPWLCAGTTYFLAKAVPIDSSILIAINIWLLSMPHTFSTFTRSDLRSASAILRTIGILLFFVAAIFFLSLQLNFVLIFTGYFLWQQFHYAKQNLGIHRWGETKEKQNWIDHLFYLLVPAIAVLGLFSRGPQVFFQYQIQNPVPLEISETSAWLGIALITTGYLLYRRSAWKKAIQHALLFSIAYLSIHEFALGWLCLNVFHNTQYLTFMYHYEKKIRFLLIPAMLTAGMYALENNGITTVFSLMLAINFTHYTLDAMIWKKTNLAFKT